MNFTRSAVHISDAYQRDIIEAQGTIGSREHTQFVTQVVADTGGWTPPPGATVIPNGGGFQIVNNNGTPWNGGEDRDGDGDIDHDDRIAHNVDLHERHAAVARQAGDHGKADYHDRAAERAKDRPDDGKGTDAGKPVILDMDGDGIEISVNSGVSFDWDDDGYVEQTAWVGADDGVIYRSAA